MYSDIMFVGEDMSECQKVMLVTEAFLEAAFPDISPFIIP